MRRNRLIISVLVLLTGSVVGSASWASAARAPLATSRIAVSLAAASTSAEAKAKKGDGDHDGDDHDGDDLPRRCSYPPVRVPTLIISGADRVKAKHDFTIDAKVKIKECARKGFKVGLYSSNSVTGPYVLLRSGVTSKTGHLTFKDLKISHYRYFEAGSAGNGRYAAATSNIILVSVRKHH